MKKYSYFLKDGNEGFSFRDVVDNLDEQQFEDAADEYCKYKFRNKQNRLLKKDINLLVLLIKGEINWLNSAIKSIKGREDEFFDTLKTKHNQKIRELESLRTKISLMK
jgi:hypothetical protein